MECVFERGTFEIPYFNPGKKACVMPYKTLSAIMDTYIAGDETYHKVLVKDKNKDGKGIKKAYIWVVMAVNTGLVYY